MDGYLRRLATRGASASMVPVLRSTSPIAAEDQRIGMFGIDVTPRDEPAPEAALSAEIHTSHERRSPTQRVPTLRIPDTPSLQVPYPPATRIEVLQAPAAEGELAAKPAPRPLPLEVRVPAAAIERPASVRVLTTPRTAARRHPTLDQRTEPENEAKPGAGIPQRLEPVPRPAPDQEKPGSADAGPIEHEVPRAPKVTIGSIHVEVISEAPEPRTTAPARQGPLTAASVSVIGPLAGKIPSNRRISLRYR